MICDNMFRCVVTCCKGSLGRLVSRFLVFHQKPAKNGGTVSFEAVSEAPSQKSLTLKGFSESTSCVTAGLSLGGNRELTLRFRGGRTGPGPAGGKHTLGQVESCFTLKEENSSAPCF